MLKISTVISIWSILSYISWLAFGVPSEMNEIKEEELFFIFDVCMSFFISLTASYPSEVQQFLKI